MPGSQAYSLCAAALPQASCLQGNRSSWSPNSSPQPRLQGWALLAEGPTQGTPGRGAATQSDYTVGGFWAGAIQEQLPVGTVLSVLPYVVLLPPNII